MERKIIIYSQNQNFLRNCSSSIFSDTTIICVNERGLLNSTLIKNQNGTVLIDSSFLSEMDSELKSLSRLYSHHIIFLSSLLTAAGRRGRNAFMPEKGRNDKKEKKLLSLTGHSAAIQKLREQVKIASECDASVLITGESGTGKTLAARLIHELSRRSEGGRELVGENIGAIAGNLIESELFGAAEGAYTDAKNRKGLFLKADKSTLFLDEIGELPYSLQPKLLYAIQDGTIRKVGEDEARKVDVRLIFATNADLREKIKNHEFREDLFYRMSQIVIEVPPLRERLEDIEELVVKIFEEEGINKSLSRGALEKLTDYSWPGNIRELANCVEQAARKEVSKFINPDSIEFFQRDLPF